MQLVHHQIAQGLRPVEAPQLAVFGAQQQEIQHFVVGQQDVRRAAAHTVPVRDDAFGGHDPGAAVLLLPAHIQAHAQTGQRGALRDEAGDASRLVRGQRVHGIDEDGLDPLPSQGPLLAAMVQHGI